MSGSLILRRIILSALATGAFVGIGLVTAADVKPAPLNPAAIKIPYAKDVVWKENAEGAANAVMVGDPTKPGFYAVLTKWHAHHSSHPHFHPNDRYITVISGTWWVGTGAKYDPEHTTPVPAGSFVTHYGKQIHYDGARDQDVVLMIMGQGPATGTPAEQK